MAVWPNGLRTAPKFASLWKQYEGKPAADHWGLDSYGYKYNCAIAPGEVIYIGWNTFGGGGREIWYRLDNGDVIVYYHNTRDGVRVSVGDRIVEGQPLGVQSDTGRADGVHNHTEVWLRGRRDSRTDPRAYIAALVGATPASVDPQPTKQEEEDMATTVKTAYYRRTSDGQQMNLSFDTTSGFYSEFSSSSGEYNTAVLKMLGSEANPLITESHAESIKRGLDRVLAK